MREFNNPPPIGTVPPSPLGLDPSLSMPEDMRISLMDSLARIGSEESTIFGRTLLGEFIDIHDHMMRSQSRMQRKMAKQRKDIRRLLGLVEWLRLTLHDRNETIRKTREFLQRDTV